MAYSAYGELLTEKVSGFGYNGEYYDADGLGNSGMKSGEVAAYFSGSWEYDGLKEALGDKLGACQLPTATIGGEAKLMKSFAGSKAVAVNPNTANSKAAMQFAAFLASVDAQKARYEIRAAIPVATALAEDPTIAADPVASAILNTIANTSVLQPTLQEMGNWWTPIETLGNNIVNGAVTKDNAEKYYYFKPEFYASLLNDMQDNAQVFWAEKDGKVIAASIMLHANGRMFYHLSGSIREYGTYAPTNLILYRAAMWGCANGCKILYLGGGLGAGVDSLFKFKKAFYKGDDLHHFYVGRKIHDPEVYEELKKIREETIENANFFPVYRG